MYAVTYPLGDLSKGNTLAFTLRPHAATNYGVSKRIKMVALIVLVSVFSQLSCLF